MLGHRRKRTRSITPVKGFRVAFKWKESKLGTLSCGKAKLKILREKKRKKKESITRFLLLEMGKLHNTAKGGGWEILAGKTLKKLKLSQETRNVISYMTAKTGNVDCLHHHIPQLDTLKKQCS